MKLNKKIAVDSLLFILCIVATFAIRSFWLEGEVQHMKDISGNNFAPFEVESAVIYSYVRAVADGKSIAGEDPGLIGSEGYTASEQMSLGMEYFLGWGLKVRRILAGETIMDATPYEDSPAEAMFIRRLLLWWVGLIPAGIFLLLRLCHVPRTMALLGALLNIVAPAAIARYTGQDLLKGEFALPFFTLFLACYCGAVWSICHRKIMLFAMAIFLFAALAFWDGTQLLLSCWGIMEILRRMLGGTYSSRRKESLLIAYSVIVVTSILAPYCRAHYFILSPLVLVIWPLALWLNCLRFNKDRGKKIILSAAFALFLFIFYSIMAGIGSYADNYNHFFTLLWAKLEFGNVKPLDPSLLNFEQRFLWTPPLNSVPWRQGMFYFPAAVWMMTLLFIAAQFTRRGRAATWRNASYYMIPSALGLFFFIFFFLFFRFHVHAAFFISFGFILLAWQIWRAYRGCKFFSYGRIIVIVALFVGIGLEAHTNYQLFTKAKRKYAPSDVMHGEQQLLAYLRLNGIEGRVVLADMRTSALLKGYAGAAIVAQPKFELKQVRDNVQEFIEGFYNASEDEFAIFCERLGVELFIFPIGMVKEPLHIYNHRYMANAEKLRPDSTAVKMEFSPVRARYFRELVLPEKGYELLRRKYRIFRFVPAEELALAAAKAEIAIRAKEEGDMATARQMAREASELDPNSEEVYMAYFEIFGDLIPPPTLDSYLKNFPKRLQ